MRLRRPDREIADRALIDAVIREARVCRLALAGADGPYVVPLCFGYDGASFYFHCAPEGRKIDVLRADPRACVEIDVVDGMREAAQACSWGIRYRSVIAFGTASIVEEAAEKRRALELLMAQYSPATYSFPDQSIENVTFIRVLIESITGKNS